MAKQLTITDPTSGVTYTLEYTRKTVEMMEKQGFIAADVEKKPMTLLPALFAGAFLAHHRFVKRDVIDNIYGKFYQDQRQSLSLPPPGLEPDGCHHCELCQKCKRSRCGSGRRP